MRRIAASVVLSLAGVLMMTPQAQGAPANAQTATVSVETLDNAQQLADLDVVDPNGAPVGHVVSVRTGSDGKAKRVMVMLTTVDGAGRVAAIRPERLTFDKTKRVLVAQFSPAQLTQLAATATTPNGIDTSRSSGQVMRPMPSSGDASPPMGR